MENVPTIVHFCPEPAKHAPVHLLYYSSNPSLRRFSAVWCRGRMVGILHEASQREVRRPWWSWDWTTIANPFSRVVFIKDFDYYTIAPPRSRLGKKKLRGM